MLFSSKNKVLRADPNYIKQMQINWENFAIVRDKKFHVQIRVFLITCLFVVRRMFSSVHFVITIISVNDEKGNVKLYFLKDSYLNMFTESIYSQYHN